MTFRSMLPSSWRPPAWGELLRWIRCSCAAAACSALGVLACLHAHLVKLMLGLAMLNPIFCRLPQPQTFRLNQITGRCLR